MQVHHVFQQTGFRRVKRGYRPLTQDGDLQKKDSWSQLRAWTWTVEPGQILDMDSISPAVVHPEDHFEKLQMAAEDKQKRGYNPLKVNFRTIILILFLSFGP